MANDIIKQQGATRATKRTATLPATNVLAFPRSCAVPSAKTRRGLSKDRPSNVLKFTGKTIHNYDCNEMRPEWQEQLLNAMRDMYARALKGEFSGVMILGAKGVPADDKDPGITYGMGGSYCTDFAFAARHTERMTWWAEEKAVECPSQPV